MRSFGFSVRIITAVAVYESFAVPPPRRYRTDIHESLTVFLFSYQASAKHAESNVEIQKLTDALTTLSTGEDISSLSANLKDFLPKVLRVDIENKRLKVRCKLQFKENVGD